MRWALRSGLVTAMVAALALPASLYALVLLATYAYAGAVMWRRVGGVWQ